MIEINTLIFKNCIVSKTSHICTFCKDIILPGDKYTGIVITDSGDIPISEEFLKYHNDCWNKAEKKVGSS